MTVCRYSLLLARFRRLSFKCECVVCEFSRVGSVGWRFGNFLFTVLLVYPLPRKFTLRVDDY